MADEPAIAVGLRASEASRMPLGLHMKPTGSYGGGPGGTVTGRELVGKDVVSLNVQLLSGGARESFP